MRTQSYWRRVFAAATMLMCLLNTGCNPFTALYFLFLMPPPKTPAACTDLEEQKVVVLVFASHGAKFVHPTIEEEILRKVVPQLRDNVDDVEIVDNKEVQQWLDRNFDFDFEEIGKQFEASRVLSIEVEEFGLYEKQSTDLFRGHARVHLQVTDIETGDQKWEDYLELKYPGARPVPVSDIYPEKFKLVFMQHMCRKIATKFFGYRPDEDFIIQ